MVVDIPILHPFRAQPRPAVDEETLAEDEEMGIPRVARRHGELVDLPPVLALVGADEDAHLGRGEHHVPIRATPEGKEELALKPDKIGEGIVVAIREELADID
jgi:hypothetical protein